MIQNEVTLYLNCPVQQVFAFLIDPKNLPTWQSSLIEIERLTEGPLHVGTQFHEVRRLGRQPAEIRGEVTDFESNKRFATKTLTEPQVTVRYSFDPENGGTRLRYKFVLLTRGVMRLLEPLIAGLIKKENASDFETLKRLLES